MPSMMSLVIRSQITLLNPLITKMDMGVQRKLQDALGALGSKALEGSVTYEDAAFERFGGAYATPKACAPGHAILYLHGGAYTAGSLAYARGFGGVLAQATHLRTLCVGYRLAPENPFPAALEDALDAYFLLLYHYEPENVYLVGESAGGGLCYALALKLKALGAPMPGKIVALSPWTDLAMTGDACARNRDIDPVLTREGLLYNAGLYAGDDLKDPLVSPLYGDVSGLPPSLLFAGTNEILEDDASRLHDKLLAAGCQSTLHIEPGMWHVYPLYGVPEGREAITEIAAFLRAPQAQ